MPLATATIGACPKPDYVPVIDWFRAAEGTDSTVPTVSYEDTLRRMGGEAEKLFARRTGDALAFGFDDIGRCFHGCPGAVVRTVHICRGYPHRLDNPDYPKPPSATSPPNGFR